ncbi:hypothetical protein [Paraburkholderia hospita]|uniref:hypothetical protein n=1 Tax=Paraburkholderia hospita TaxID=169430 RepID=UPI000B343B60|nr:hypothetical protein [Paraburkholderia hospita]OUL97141.1 hypothetical protein CA601_00795 [Paraburkholderia hospita]
MITDIDPELLRVQERIEGFGRALNHQQEMLTALITHNRFLETELGEFLEHELREAYRRGYAAAYEERIEAERAGGKHGD